MPDYTVWQDPQLAARYLAGVRSAIPLAQEQLDLLCRLARAACPAPARILDLGCGDGILGHVLLDTFPRAHGVFVDLSETMLSAARLRLREHAGRVEFLKLDYGTREWRDSLGAGSFALVVSGFSIHHQPDARKKELYGEIHGLLEPGGLFLNLEHVKSANEWGKERFDDAMVDALWAHHRARGAAQDRAAVAHEYYHRPDMDANILTTLDEQCTWLRDLGFERVDCYFKYLELALFGGFRR